MDFSVIFQLRTKKFWWMDVIFYFVISLLVATVFCYIIFLTKDYFLRQNIADEIAKLQTVGTETQKQQEADVINYKNKIGNFSDLFKNHTFASNVFAFVQAQTMPNIWFKQFNLDEKNGVVQLSGEANDMDGLSRQVKVLESESNNKYIKNVGNLSSSLGDSARVEFNINLTLNQNIFNYISSEKPIVAATISPDQSAVQQSQTAQPANEQQGSPTQSMEKLITSFHLLLIPEVVGTIDETNYNVLLNVPYGTDLKNLTPSIDISSGATISPASGVLQDFTNPVTYIITAQDNSVRSYKVAVNVLPQVVEKSQSNLITWIIVIIIFVVVIIIVVAVFFFLKRRKINKYSK
jgi:hypothetical protein